MEMEISWLYSFLKESCQSVHWKPEEDWYGLPLFSWWRGEEEQDEGQVQGQIAASHPNPLSSPPPPHAGFITLEKFSCLSELRFPHLLELTCYKIMAYAKPLVFLSMLSFHLYGEVLPIRFLKMLSLCILGEAAWFRVELEVLKARIWSQPGLWVISHCSGSPSSSSRPSGLAWCHSQCITGPETFGSAWVRRVIGTS